MAGAIVLVLALATAACSSGGAGAPVELNAGGPSATIPPSTDFAGTLSWARTRSEAVDARAARIAGGKLEPAAAVAECSRLISENLAIKRRLESAKAPAGTFDPRTGLFRAINERGAELAAGMKLFAAEAGAAQAQAALPEKERLAGTLTSEAAQNPGVRAMADAAAAEVAKLRATVQRDQGERASLEEAYRAASDRARAAASAWKAF